MQRNYLILRAVGESQNLGWQYCLTYFGQCNLSPHIHTPIKIKKCFENLSEFIMVFQIFFTNFLKEILKHLIFQDFLKKTRWAIVNLAP